jgi:hypothetical protein
MPLYAGKDIDLLIAAINRDNPAMTWKLNATDFIYSKPQKYLVPNQLDHNTQMRITAKESSPYRGNVIVTYRRIDLSILFRSQRLELKKFITTGTWLYKEAYIPLINKKYGLNLDPADVTGAGFYGGWQTFTRNLVMGDESYQYVGTIDLYWSQDLEELGLDVLTQGELAGAVWPTGRGLYDPEETFPLPLRNEFLPLYRDYTEDSVAGLWPTTTTQSSFIWSASMPQYGFKALLDEINVAYNLGIKYEDFHATDNPNGIYGRTMGWRFMPINAGNKVTYPFLNRDGATHVLLLWFANHPTFGQAAMGYLPFYYNV